MSSSGLPTHLFETYAYYKKNTSSFIRWLSAHNKDTKERSSIISVRELICLANTVISRRITVPVELFHNLGKTIRARTRVSRFFKSVARPEDREALLSHEYFTQALQQIHTDLRELTAKCKHSIRRPDDNALQGNANPFENLHWEDCLQDEKEAQPADRKRAPIQRITAESSGPSLSRRSEKDNIGEFMAIAIYLSVSPSNETSRVAAEFVSLGT